MVIPVGDHNPTRRTPYVTWLLLAVNIGVFVLLQPWSADTCRQHAFFLDWAVVPEEVFSGEPLDAGEVAATTPPACSIAPAPDKNVYAAVLYSLFLHAGWVHLLGNMLYLWIFGNNVEDRLGHVGFLAFYLGCGVVATLAFALPNATSPVTLVGASGAIAGVLGAYLLLYPGARVTVLVPFLFFLPLRLPALLVLGLWFVLQLGEVRVAEMAGTGVAYLAHVAGFLAGMAVISVIGRGRQPPPRRAAPRGYPPPGHR